MYSFISPKFSELPDGLTVEVLHGITCLVVREIEYDIIDRGDLDGVSGWLGVLSSGPRGFMAFLWSKCEPVRFALDGKPYSRVEFYRWYLYTTYSTHFDSGWADFWREASIIGPGHLSLDIVFSQ